MPDDTIRAALKRHAKEVDFAVSRFSSDLDAVVSKAQSALQQQLLDRLKIDPKSQQILRTPANIRIIKQIPQLWRQDLQAAGLDDIVGRYLKAYPDQIPAFEDVLTAINTQAQQPLPLPSFSGTDKKYFDHLALASVSDITAAIETAANGVITRVAFQTGVMPYKALVKTIVETTNTSKARAETLANTSLMGFYRKVSLTGYEKIQRKVSKTLKFKILGPDDSKTREFCDWLLHQNKLWTLAELDALDNGSNQPKPVTVYLGGWNCRHSLNLAPVDTMG